MRSTLCHLTKPLLASVLWHKGYLTIVMCQKMSYAEKCLLWVEKLLLFLWESCFLGVLFYFKCFNSHSFLANIPVYTNWRHICVYCTYTYVNVMSDTSFIATVWDSEQPFIPALQPLESVRFNLKGSRSWQLWSESAQSHAIFLFSLFWLYCEIPINFPHTASAS